MQNTFPFDLNELLSGGSKNIFYINLRDYRALTPDQLYGEHKKLLENTIDQLNSKLYMITRIPKMRFKVDDCRMGFNFNVIGRLKFSNGRELKFDASMAKFWHEAPEYYDKFSSEIELAGFFLERSADFSYFNILPTKLKYRLFSYVRRDLSSESKLVINCALSRVIAGFKRINVDLYPYRVANLCDMEIGNYPEVLYIGISNKDILRRVSNHEKLQEILAVNGDHHDLLIYFMSLENSNVSFENSGDSIFYLLKGPNNRISIKDQTEMAKTALIKYFNPKFNEKKTKKEVARNEKVKKNLIGNGYTEILCELNTYGILSRLGTNSVQGSNNHIIKYRLSNS